MRDAALDFLQECCRPSRLEPRALLRGVYLTSGTQDGTPIDRLLGTMAAEFGLSRQAAGSFSGTGRSYASEFFVPLILDDEFSTGYPLQDAYKDLVSGAELGAGLCIPMPVLAAATATYQAALLRGHGRSDKGAMIKVYEELLGVRFRRSNDG